MARPCTVCRHPNREAIDSALRLEPYRVVAKRFGIGEAAANRHKTDHLKSAKRSKVAVDGEAIEASTPAALHPLEQAKRDTEVLDLRLSGLAPRAIATKTGIGVAMVRDILRRALGDAVADREDRAGHLLEIELSRLDRLQAALWARATDPACAEVMVPADNEAGCRPYDGQDKAVDRVLKIAERRHKLLGLEKAPEVVGKEMPVDASPPRFIVELTSPERPCPAQPPPHGASSPPPDDPATP